ncbi:hypothetical protein KJ853_01670 [Patescibacteria group bacterium]|nr:hypothetical protein [Patescibacteria group bacterium]
MNPVVQHPDCCIFYFYSPFGNPIAVPFDKDSALGPDCDDDIFDIKPVQTQAVSFKGPPLAVLVPSPLVRIGFLSFSHLAPRKPSLTGFCSIGK